MFTTTLLILRREGLMTIASVLLNICSPLVYAPPHNAYALNTRLVKDAGTAPAIVERQTDDCSNRKV